ncbi:MAG: Os1348 family NHLP clan protein [Chloroflexota bacterium]
MSREALVEVLDRFLNQPAFRVRLRRDAESAVNALGLDLDDSEWAALRGIDWSLTDGQLRARLGKMGQLW